MPETRPEQPTGSTGPGIPGPPRHTGAGRPSSSTSTASCPTPPAASTSWTGARRDWTAFFEACGDDPVIEEIARLLELLDSVARRHPPDRAPPPRAGPDAGLVAALRPALGPPGHALARGLRPGHRVQAVGRARTCGPTASICGSPSRTIRRTTPCTWRPACPASTSTPGTTSSASCRAHPASERQRGEHQHRKVAPVVVGREAAAQGDGGEEHLAPAECAALHDDAALGDDRAEPGRGGLDEVAPGLDGLDDRRGDLLGRHLGGAVGGRVGGNGQQLGAGPDRLVAAPGVEDLEGDQEPQGAGGGAHEARCRGRGRRRPARRRGRRSARRTSGAARTRRRAPGAPSRRRRRCGRSGPQATTSLRNEVVDAGSVTPTSSVVWSCRASRLRSAAWGDPASGRSSATTSSGHSTRAGAGCGRGHGERRRQLCGETELGDDLLLAQAPLPATLHQGDAQGPERRSAVGRDRAHDGQHDDPAAMTTAPTSPATATRPCSVRRRPAPRAAGGARVATATPPAQTPAVMSSGPPRRASWTSGAAGLAEEHAAEREPAEGPRHAHAPRRACRRPRRRAHARAAAAWPRPRPRRRAPRRG